jgi:hypothetical protein
MTTSLEELERIAEKTYFEQPGAPEGDLPTYVDDEGRTIKVCPTRWAYGVSAQPTTVMPVRRPKRLSF